MRRYGALLADDPAFIVPTPYAALSGARVLAMDFISGVSIEKLEGEPQETRDQAMAALLDLVLRELFQFGYMQTDPNFANYRWQAESGKIVLLDFGAARPVPDSTVAAYRRLMQAGLDGDTMRLLDTLVDAGFIAPATVTRHQAALDGMIDILMRHLGRPGLFDFSDRSFIEDVRRYGETIFADRAAWHIPPAETLFVQRKVSGTALLAIKMQAKLPLRDMVAERI